MNKTTNNAPIADKPVTNAMTVDVEDYFQVSAFSRAVARDQWGSFESRVERNTRWMLECFERHGIKATFFVLGWVAERYPAIVAEIAESGHEVACHGYSHELVYNQTPDEFAEETRRSKAVLEDIVQKPVIGYRAASFSVTRRSWWALETIVDAGFSYDSSLFPVRHDNYGVSGVSTVPHRLDVGSGKSIVEFPMSTFKLMGMNLPVSGGGYFRLYPYGLTRFGLDRINRRSGEPFIFYLHPWEIDPDQPRIPAGWKSRFRHYNNLHKTETRLERLFGEFSFSTARDVLEGRGLI